MSQQNTIESMQMMQMKGPRRKNNIHMTMSNITHVQSTQPKKKAAISKVHPRVQQLLQIPKIEQKTPEWYEARHNLITASDFAQALGKGKFGTQKQLIMKKVEPNTDTQAKTNIFFEWGNLFEPVACMIYAKMKATRVHEFGLLKHPAYAFFGASPDGITDEGIMLEIKCPLKRKIEVGGDVPQQYYYQIQGQLDVCDLDDCDYFECEFAKYDTYEEFHKAYIIASQSDTTIWNGIFVNKECIVCEDTTCCTESQEPAAQYWILSKYNIKRVQRDKQFVRSTLEQLGEVWKKIEYYRENTSAYQMEMKKTISISTQSIKTISGEEDTAQHIDMMKPVTLKGYKLVKLED